MTRAAAIDVLATTRRATDQIFTVPDFHNGKGQCVHRILEFKSEGI